MAQSANAKVMSSGIPRWIFRLIHIILAIPIYGYIYSAFEKLPLYAPPTRYVFFPLMVLTGLWRPCRSSPLFEKIGGMTDYAERSTF